MNHILRPWTAGIAVLVAVTLAGCTSSPAEPAPSAGRTEPTANDAPQGNVILVTNEGFAFSPAEIRVKKGEPVTVAFTSKGGQHDWVVDEFAAATAVVSSGQTADTTFVPDRTGSFQFYCSVGNHRELGMVGTLIVE